MNNLSWRLLTAVVLIPLILSALYVLTPIYFAIFSGIVFALAMVEWAKLCRLSLSGQIKSFLIQILLMGALYNLQILKYVQYGFIIWIYPIWVVLAYNQNPHRYTSNKRIFYVLGYILLTLAWLTLNILRIQHGPNWILLIFLLVWSTDTFAYFAGRMWGRRSFFPKISPKKTWAGFWGGLLGTLTLGTVLYWIFPYVLTMEQTLMGFILVLGVVLLSVFGDLFESMLKRIANMKDSSQWLPGHGGLLDRIDSLIAALPFFLFCLNRINI